MTKRNKNSEKHSFTGGENVKLTPLVTGRVEGSALLSPCLRARVCVCVCVRVCFNSIGNQASATKPGFGPELAAEIRVAVMSGSAVRRWFYDAKWFWLVGSATVRVRLRAISVIAFPLPTTK